MKNRVWVVEKLVGTDWVPATAGDLSRASARETKANLEYYNENVKYRVRAYVPEA